MLHVQHATIDISSYNNVSQANQFLHHQSLLSYFPSVSAPYVVKNTWQEKELNSLWEERFSHSFTSELPRNAPEENLAKKMSRTEKKVTGP